MAANYTATTTTMATSRGHQPYDESLSAYLREIVRYPLLSADEELSLGARAAEGDRAAREQLVTCNLRLVVTIAKRYHAHDLTLLDLIQEGNVGLMRAAEKYDGRNGVRFATYASWWIRQTIGRALMTHDRAIAVPSHVQESAQRVRRVISQLSAELGRAPTDAEMLAAAPDVITPAVLERLRALPPRQLASLDAPLFSDREPGGVLGDLIADETPSAQIEAQVEAQEEQHQLYDLLRAHLEPRELAVIALRYRLGTLATPNNDGRYKNKPAPYHLVASKLNISGEMARLIEGEALTKLRRALSLTSDGVFARVQRQQQPTKKQPKQPATTAAKKQQPKKPTKSATVKRQPQKQPARPTQRSLKQLLLFGDVAS